MRAKLIYGEPDDPVMRHIVGVIGSEGVNLWHARQVAAVMALFERDPSAAIDSNQFTEIAQATCPRSRAEVDAEACDDSARGALDMRNNLIVGGILGEAANGGRLALARFTAIILSAGPKAEAQIKVAIEKATSAAQYPTANSTGRVN